MSTVARQLLQRLRATTVRAVRATSDAANGTEDASSPTQAGPSPPAGKPRLPLFGEGQESWLAHSHGFLVDSLDGKPVGVVDEVEIDPRSGLARALHVSTGWFGRRRLTIPATAVKRILPRERRLYIDSLPQEGESKGRQRR